MRFWPKPKKLDAGQACMIALRVAPWVVFGPITGLLSERAFRCYTRGERVLAGLYVALNISILIAIPSLTVALAV